MKKIILMLIVLVFSCNQRDELTFPEESEIFQIKNDDLKIISPKFGETWQPGSNQKIKWILKQEIKKVQILLFRKTELMKYLASSFPNNGEYEWNIPKDFINSVHYRVKIIAIDIPRINATSEYFYIKSNFNSNEKD